MKPCRVPKSLKVGSKLYSFSACSYDDDTSSVIAHEWHVRSIQNRSTWINIGGTQILNHARKAMFVFMASKKKGLTWVNGNWAKYIPKDYSKKFELIDFLPEGVYTTELQAIKFAVQKWEANISWYENLISSLVSAKEIREYEEELSFTKKELKLLKSRKTRVQNTKKAA